MRKLVLMAMLLLPVAACTQTQQGAVIGGASGAAIGAAVANNPVEGALIGGAVGAAAGALIGRAAEGSNRCVYRDRYGRRYIADCPPGY
jgi:outer membrane lipoprotein SlyB